MLSLSKLPTQLGLHAGALAALLAAALFGLTTPLAKLLLQSTHPVMLAALLYLGSGIGLLGIRLWRDRGWQAPGVRKGEWPWLWGAVGFGGVLAPLALMAGLSRTSATSASLLLNMEAVLTACLAWWVFKENAGPRVVLGMGLIVAAGVALALGAAPGNGFAHLTGSALILAACLCWAIDNNLTRKVSAADALFVAGCKGGVAGCVNLAIALALSAEIPHAPIAGAAMAIGLAGYGISLVLFVLALRSLGTARTGAYFGVAPFVGAFASVVWLGEPTSPALWIGSALMAAGVWLHLTEHHAHAHTHQPLDHDHEHVHDEHHQHEHAFDWDSSKPHRHPHQHAPITHSHAHHPDIHHQHAH